MSDSHAGNTAPMWQDAAHGHTQRKAVVSDDLTAKTADQSSVTLAHIMAATDTNLYGGVHGGVIMKLVDDAAAASAARHAGGPAVTASVDGMTFMNPALVGDLLKVEARLARAGRTSMDVVVHVSAQRWNESGPDRAIVRAFLTFVAVDADGRPRNVPPLVAVDEDDEQLAQEAISRRASRASLTKSR